MRTSKTVLLEVEEWYGTCPECESGFTLNNDNTWTDDGTMKDIICDECGENLSPEPKN